MTAGQWLAVVAIVAALVIAVGLLAVLWRSMDFAISMADESARARVAAHTALAERDKWKAQAEIADETNRAYASRYGPPRATTPTTAPVDEAAAPTPRRPLLAAPGKHAQAAAADLTDSFPITTGRALQLVDGNAPAAT